MTLKADAEQTRPVRTVADLRALLATLPDDALIGVGAERNFDAGVADQITGAEICTTVKTPDPATNRWRGDVQPCVVLWFGEGLFEVQEPDCY